MAAHVSPGLAPARQILFVDDEPVLRQVFSIILTHEGYATHCAGDGLEALKVMKEVRPDLVISDLRMPRMSGFEFLSVVRRRFPEMPLIAISGEYAAAPEALLAVADAFFIKGHNSPDVMLGKIAELLARPSRRTQTSDIPVWVPLAQDGLVTLSCPHCLRCFQVPARTSANGESSRAQCASCGTLLFYHADMGIMRAAEAHCAAMRMKCAS